MMSVWRPTMATRRRIPRSSTQPDVTIIFNTHQVYPNGSNLTPADADKNYDGVTARLELDYKPSDNILYYLSYNRGGKSGGFTFSTGTPFAPGQVAFLNGMPYKPEVLTDYEAGAKVTLNNTTAINASFYHYSYDNYQAFAQVGTTQTLVNLHAVANGMEIELNSHPITGLTLQLSPAFEQSRVYHILLPDFVSVVNHDLPQAPHFSGNASANYDFPLGNGNWFGWDRRDLPGAFLLYHSVRARGARRGLCGRGCAHRLQARRGTLGIRRLRAQYVRPGISAVCV